MTSHELAELLLELPDLPFTVVGLGDKEGSDKGYTVDLSVSPPWQSGVGDIRVQGYQEEV